MRIYHEEGPSTYHEEGPSPITTTPHNLPRWVLGILAEILQYMEAGSWLGISKNSLLGILLGATGDVLDVVCYGVGAGMVCAGIWIYKRLKPAE